MPELVKQPSKAAVSAWARLVRAHQHLSSAVQAEFKAAGLPSLEWYDVLLELGRAKDGGLPPSELESECMVVQYNLSRLLDRMQAKGLVRRVPYPGDKRRQLVEITAKGRQLRERMWPVYAEALSRLVCHRLGEKDAERLSQLLGRLIDREN